MALSETQLAGLKKTGVQITDDDLSRVMTALGLRKAATDELDAQLFTLRIIDGFSACCMAYNVPSESARVKAWRLDFYVRRDADAARLGAVHRMEDLNILQRKGAAVMQELFTSVDDLEPYTCTECGTGLLTWDGNTGSRTLKPGMACGACGWRGHTGAWVPLRDWR